MTVAPPPFDRQRALNDGSISADERVAALDMRALVAAAVEDVRVLALSGAGASQLEERLAMLDHSTAGRKSRACGVLAEQILLWFDVHGADRANALCRNAVTEHVAAAVFRRLHPATGDASLRETRRLS